MENELNALERTTRLEKIINGNQEPVGKRTIRFRGQSRDMDVYEIPLDSLIYNKYNGRILSRTKSLETQGVVINPETPDGKRLIENLLWNSKEDKNKKTEQDLREYGQQEPGIVTRDGVIVDANRRAMLLTKIGATHLRAVILDVKIDEDQREIERLETMYQMGADEKQDYNPIEKYLKVNEMIQLGFDKKEIADCMSESVAIITEMLEIFEIMNQYLDHIQCSGLFTELDGREGQLKDLAAWAKKYRGEASTTPFPGYKEADVDDMIMIAFDYIREKKEGKDFRKIAGGNHGHNFFSNKKIWENFRNRHFNTILPISDEEETVDLRADNLEKVLRARTDEWVKKVDSPMKANWGKTVRQLDDESDKDRPAVLLERAKSALVSIDTDSEHFTPELLGIIREINQLSTQLKKQLGA
jgi:hypothetical protein